MKQLYAPSTRTVVHRDMTVRIIVNLQVATEKHPYLHLHHLYAWLLLQTTRQPELLRPV